MYGEFLFATILAILHLRMSSTYELKHDEKNENELLHE
jgi:hypothetical protein